MKFLSFCGPIDLVFLSHNLDKIQFTITLKELLLLLLEWKVKYTYLKVRVFCLVAVLLFWTIIGLVNFQILESFFFHMNKNLFLRYYLTSIKLITFCFKLLIENLNLVFNQKYLYKTNKACLKILAVSLLLLKIGVMSMLLSSGNIRHNSWATLNKQNIVVLF